MVYPAVWPLAASRTREMEAPQARGVRIFFCERLKRRAVRRAAHECGDCCDSDRCETCVMSDAHCGWWRNWCSL